MIFNTRTLQTAVIAALLGATVGSLPLSAAENQQPPSEQQLIEVLRSDAAPAEKAITCKKLAVYGSKEAVPALAPLLLDRELTSWARIALEAIPDSAADEALRAAVPRLQGRLLIGTINSIGVRQDVRAVGILVGKLQDSDSDVASAAAEALGHIGTDDAARSLQEALTSAQAAVRSAAAYGCVLCAEKFAAVGKGTEAASLCDRVRQANVPKQRILEATRGAILARDTGGIPLLLECLKSPDLGLFNIGVRTARELPGRDTTQAISKELDQAAPDRQVAILLALADRSDAAVLPKVLQVAEHGSKATRLAAIGLLDRFHDLACVPVLLTAATESDAELARTAKAGLARIGGKEVEADLLARLRLASGKSRQVLLELAGLRHIESAVPVVMRSTEDGDPAVRRAALETIGVLGNEQQAGELVRLLSGSQSSDDREDIERSLSAICRHRGSRCLPEVLPLAKTGNSATRKIGLRALSSIGGSEALGVVKAAVDDPDATIQDEAVNLLSTWPNTWPEDGAVAEPLLALVKSGKKESYRVQGLRGYLQYLEENKNLNNDEKVAKINDLLPYAKGAEEKRQVISVAATIPATGSLKLLEGLAQDQGVTDEACLAIFKVATDRNMRQAPIDVRRQALKTVEDKSSDEGTRNKAAAALKRLE
jgi:HEAT repeat protein